MFDVPLFLQAGTLVPLRNRNAFLFEWKESCIPTCIGAPTPPYQRSKTFCHNQTYITIATNQTLAILSSEFEGIMERCNQVYAIDRELLIFTKLIVVNVAWLCQLVESKLQGQGTDMLLGCGSIGAIMPWPGPLALLHTHKPGRAITNGHCLPFSSSPTSNRHPIQRK